MCFHSIFPLSKYHNSILHIQDQLVFTLELIVAENSENQGGQQLENIILHVFKNICS